MNCCRKESLTRIKEGNLPGVSLPKVLPLVQGVLRRAPLLNIRIVWIRHDDTLTGGTEIESLRRLKVDVRDKAEEEVRHVERCKIEEEVRIKKVVVAVMTFSGTYCITEIVEACLDR